MLLPPRLHLLAGTTRPFPLRRFSNRFSSILLRRFGRDRGGATTTGPPLRLRSPQPISSHHPRQVAVRVTSHLVQRELEREGWAGRLLLLWRRMQSGRGRVSMGPMVAAPSPMQGGRSPMAMPCRQGCRDRHPTKPSRRIRSSSGAQPVNRVGLFWVAPRICKSRSGCVSCMSSKCRLEKDCHLLHGVLHSMIGRRSKEELDNSRRQWWGVDSSSSSSFPLRNPSRILYQSLLSNSNSNSRV